MDKQEKILFVDKVGNFFVKQRFWIFGVMMAFVILCVVALPFVTINDDFASFLPADSEMRQGLKIMNEQWPAVEGTTPMQGRSFVLMTVDATDLQTAALEFFLNDYDGVASFSYIYNDPRFNYEGYRLFLVNTTHASAANAATVMNGVVSFIEGQNVQVFSELPGYFGNIMDFMLPIAVALMLTVLVLFCQSWFDPILIFVGLGAAVLMNLGTNIFLPSVGDMTSTIASVLQLLLSIVCTMILLTRYRYEKSKLDCQDPKLAMKNAIRNSTKTILSACIATFLGLLSLMIMSFGIGREMGLVFSKGVFFTVVSLFSIMPTLIIWSDKLIEKFDKANIKAKRLAKKEAKNANSI